MKKRNNFSKLFAIFLICIFFFLSINSKIAGLYESVVVDLIVLNDKSSSQACPSGYEDTSGCDDDKCDLNYKAGGNYIYLCQKKKQFKQLSSKDKPISLIKVIYNSKNCGNLNLIDSDLNKKARGDYVYLCYGEDEEDPTPISDVFINIRGKNEVPSGYVCDPNDVNEGTYNGKKIYICFYKNKNIPILVEYSNIFIETNRKSLLEIQDDNEITYIDNDNSSGDSELSIKRKISKIKENMYSFNFNESLSISSKLTMKSSIPLVISEDISLNVQFDENEDYRYSHYEIKKEEIEYSCLAPARKHLMCKAFISKYKISVPYHMNIIYHYQNGTKEVELYNSVLTGLIGSKIHSSKCCISGCENNDNLCTEEEIKNNDFISGSCPVFYNDKIIINDNDYKVEDNNIKSQKNDDYYVVTDIKIISSSKKSITCPSGYEVVNSGCKSEGCDLNAGASGNYIYLCQKKQKLSSLRGNEKPINTVEILFGYKERCSSNSLTFIDEDLNKNAGGEYVYICYGYLENMLSDPIVDFFVYIEKINSPPEGYKCETNKNLNEQTFFGGKEIYLCYTTNKNFAGSGTGGIDKTNTVITDLDIIVSKKKKADCPNGYEIVNEGCATTGCDLNNRAGGKYIYLCQKRQKFDKLTLTQKPVNSFKILFNKSENENSNLKLIDADLNTGCGGEYIYLAYGYEPDQSLSPIVDFFIHILKVNNPPQGYECDKNDLNKRAGGSYIYLCYKRDVNLPKEILVDNLELNYAQAKKVSYDLPDKIEEIIVDSTSIQKKVEKTVTEEKNMLKSSINEYSLEVSFSFLFLKELGYSLNYNSSLSEEWKEINTKILSTEIECKAVQKKKMMCIPFFSNYNLYIPYTASLTYLNYNGEILEKKKIKGIFEKITTSQISYKACCLEGCCSGDSLSDAGKTQCANNKKDILCSKIQSCF